MILKTDILNGNEQKNVSASSNVTKGVKKMIFALAPIRAKEAGYAATEKPDLEEWIGQYGNGLLRLCFLQLGDYAMAEDALQDTFIKAYLAYDRFEHRCSTKTWLTTIAINVCRSMRRSAWNRKNISLESLGDMPGTDETTTTPDNTVFMAIMKLPPDLKEIVLMHTYQGIKLREIAELLKLPMTTVTSRYNRAKQQLRKALKEWYFDEE